MATATAVDAVRDRQRAKQRLLDKKQLRESALRADMELINKDRERLSGRLVETAKAIQNSERQMSLIEGALKKLKGRESDMRAALAQRHDTIAKLLAAMQRMGRNPPPVMITRRKDALKMVRSAMLLAATFPELREKALDLAKRLTKLQQVVEESRAQRQKLRAETDRLNDTQTRLATLMEEKRHSLSKRQAELAELRREASEIKKTVSGLGELIAKLDSAVAARTRLGSYNEIQKRGLPAGTVLKRRPPETRKVATLVVPKPPNAGPSAKPKIPGRQSDPDAVVIAPSTNINLIRPGRLQPAIPFSRAKGQLPRPAQGRQIVSFGEKTQYGAKSKGIVISTRHGAQITSPSDGWVVYAGEFRSYGQLLIINGGQEYHVLLAGMSRIDVQLGQFVLAGEPVGTMSAAGREQKTASQKSAPVLYVEFRKNGRPINPRPWWARES